MINRKSSIPFLAISCFLLLPASRISGQMITGSWKGRINRQKVEVKIIQKGDSLTGTSYYYESPQHFRRYSIKGYFDAETNSAVWWDDQLLEERSARFSLSLPGKVPMLSRADFNCPGGSRMMLDGKTARKENDTKTTGEVHLDKTQNPEFEDEWDYVIDNYTVGTNDPYIIDSIETLASIPPEKPVPEKIPLPEKTEPLITRNEPRTVPAIIPVTEKKPEPAVEKKITTPEIVPTIEEKFISRKKVLIKEIPVTGDSIELRFYDNAEIDGDSISLFLNNRLLLQHIRLTGNAYILKLAVNELEDSNELIMVAENLGSIPPNTSYMVAIVGEQRYDAYLSSTEGSSAMIRLTRK